MRDSLGVSVFLGLFVTVSAHAQTATDLECANCVDRSDIAAKAVTGPKIGNSAVTTDKIQAGAGGFRQMAAACQTDFGPNARLATSAEIVVLTNFPSFTGFAWVQPVIIAGSNGFFVDMSGRSMAQSDINCDGWSSGTGSGLVIDSDYGFGSLGCSAARVPACSVPE